ncbi:anti-sigma factor [Frankia sp. AgB32]|uniref:anti-sigma factor n=1 Tax=Frankia sp. AgB32 TaxID=631119 RepID=UPI00200E5283|nr:anti-sigma factor [Frankia sp. AgB32]MCK9896591.1 anti-sigma factor [Frankia sp. AgB32]
MTSPEAHTLIGAYALDALDDAERARLESHLAACPECATELRELRAVATTMGGAVPRTPPASLRAAVLREIETTPQLPPRLADRRSRGQRRATFAAIASGVAAVVAFVALGVVGTLTINQRHQLADVRAQAADLEAVASEVAARSAQPMAGGGRLAVVAVAGRAFVDIRDLPDLPANRVYQLWAASAKGVESAGIVGGNVGRAHRLLALGKEATAVKVTVEPAGGSKQPTSAVIGSAPLPG